MLKEKIIFSLLRKIGIGKHHPILSEYLTWIEQANECDQELKNHIYTENCYNFLQKMK